MRTRSLRRFTLWGIPLSSHPLATEDMTDAQLGDLTDTVDTEIEKQQRRQQRQWESVLNEVGKQNPDPTQDLEFEKKLTNLVLGTKNPRVNSVGQ